MQLGERVVDCQELDWSEEAEEYMVEHGTRLQIVQPEEEECGEGLAEMEYTLSDNGSESAAVSLHSKRAERKGTRCDGGYGTGGGAVREQCDGVQMEATGPSGLS